MKAGLEIHQQLATGKLFCNCGDELTEEVRGEFVRALRATGGETGEADAAAVLQASRAKVYRYQVVANSCLVESDEEPPHRVNPEALRVALTMAELLGSRVVQEILIMRKLVVDGSNTAGFQRTALIAVGGEVEAAGKRYGISSVCLEEDAARKIGETPGEITYRLDRLGIPLIEIATAPEIHSGREAREVAEAIGQLLRATHRVKRGIGTIREDLNISIEGGARVEIKGVQELGAVESFVENEAARQATLLEVGRRIRGRPARLTATFPAVDLTPLLSSSPSKVLSSELKRGGVVLGVPLPGLGGLLAPGDKAPERLGRELADYARASGVKGILHSDELPGYGITAEEVARVREALKVPDPQDAFAIVVAPAAEPARRALNAVLARAAIARQGVPEETRDPVAEGRTRYSRPLPGRNRMYPETDLPPFRVPPELLTDIRNHLPESPAATLARLAGNGLSSEVAGTLLREGLVEVFDALITEKHPPSIVARILTQEVPALERETGKTVFDGKVPFLDQVRSLLTGLARGEFAKEAIGPVLARMFTHGEDLATAVRGAGVGQLSPEDLRRIVEEVMARNEELIRTKGMGAMSPLMGDVMARVRGKIDGQLVAESVRTALQGKVGRTPAP